MTEQPPVHDWLQVIRGEFLEMPGLNLTRQQVQRLWGLDPDTCDTVLRELVDARFLRRTPDGRYVLFNRAALGAFSLAGASYR
jgi:DNA-binding IclR family transcriptional regulator